MIVSVLKMHFRKLLPRLISYRYFSDYDNVNFIDLQNKIPFENENRGSCLKILITSTVCTAIFNKNSPHKKKYLRQNIKQFMNKSISKVTILRTKLSNKLLKYPTTASRTSSSK